MKTLYQRVLEAGVLTQRELDRYQNLNELSKNSDVVLDKFSLEFSNEITARIDAFLESNQVESKSLDSFLSGVTLGKINSDSRFFDTNQAYCLHQKIRDLLRHTSFDFPEKRSRLWRLEKKTWYRWLRRVDKNNLILKSSETEQDSGESL